jgi:hypothetical protein
MFVTMYQAMFVRERHFKDALDSVGGLDFSVNVTSKVVIQELVDAHLSKEQSADTYTPMGAALSFLSVAGRATNDKLIKAAVEGVAAWLPEEGRTARIASLTESVRWSRRVFLRWRDRPKGWVQRYIYRSDGDGFLVAPAAYWGSYEQLVGLFLLSRAVGGDRDPLGFVVFAPCVIAPICHKWGSYENRLAYLGRAMYGVGSWCAANSASFPNVDTRIMVTVAGRLCRSHLVRNGIGHWVIHNGRKGGRPRSISSSQAPSASV